MKDLKARLVEKQIYVEFSSKTKDYILDNGYSLEYGARPIKRFIQRNIETLIAHEIISERLTVNSRVLIDVVNDQLVVLNK